MFQSGFAAFAESIGANPAHPDMWTDAQRAAYRAWQVGRFKAHWRWLIRLGQPDLIRQQSGRAALINEVRRDWAAAMAPPPTHPWKSCRCHRQRFVDPTMTPDYRDAVDDEDVAVWRARDRATRQTMPRTMAVALCYLESFRPTRKGPTP